MRRCARTRLGSSLLVLGVGGALAACVGNDPTTTSGDSSDASSSDGSSSTDGAGNDTGSSTTPDASDDAATETFDGANPTCNGLFPQDAPATTTIECDGGPIIAVGGDIGAGRYYLADEKFAGCLSVVPPYDDVVNVTAMPDGGLLVELALDRAAPLYERATLAWAVDKNIHTFDQYNLCGNDGGAITSIPYSVTSDGLTYFIGGFGDVTLKPF